MKKSILVIILILIFNGFCSSISISMNSQKNLFKSNEILIDYDPQIDINITLKIDYIRALKAIDDYLNNDFFVKIFINNLEFNSSLFKINKNSYNLNYSIMTDVPDDVEIVEIIIQLYTKNQGEEELCDISGDIINSTNKYDVKLFYNIKTSHWDGSDYINDPSGYGRLNGCDDGSIYNLEKDFELFFNIYQNDFDNDNIPYWTEVYTYNTDPEVKNLGDPDNDKIPIEWEYRWGYNPFIWDDHTNIDPDLDSINNYEEYLTKNFNSDPFRKDIFLEIDYMQEANGDVPRIEKTAFEILKLPFHKRNILLHIDSGEINGGDIISYDEKSDFDEILEIWRKYFLDNNEQNWKRSVFHYGVFVHDQFPKGYAFSGDISPYWGYLPGTNSFVIANVLIEKKARTFKKSNNTIYASAIMHEMGHNFGIRGGNPKGCDNQLTKNPFLPGWYIYRNYKSIMNYRYTYSILDYSDGTNGKRDYNDWGAVNLSYFEIPKNENLLT